MHAGKPLQRKAQRAAEASLRKFIKERKEKIELQTESLIQDAETFEKAGRYELARKALELALKTTTDKEEIKKRLAELERKNRNTSGY